MRGGKGEGGGGSLCLQQLAPAHPATSSPSRDRVSCTRKGLRAPVGTFGTLTGSVPTLVSST